MQRHAWGVGVRIRMGRLALVGGVAAMMLATGVSAAGATVIGNVKVARKILPAPLVSSEETGKELPGLGAVELNKVGILKIAPTGRKARNVLVLEPGTSAAAAYFVPFAKSLVEASTGWQVWAVERRQNFLENQKELTKYKRHKVSSQEFFDYYFGYLVGAQIKHHYEPLKPSSVAFAKQWGMSVAVEDLKAVIEEAKKLGGKVVLGGHSLGGSVVTAYATWDFAGKPGAEGLSGLVYDDGGSSPLAISQTEAESSLAKLEEPSETPWLAFGGISAPDLGLFSATGSALTNVEPDGPSLLENSSACHPSSGPRSAPSRTKPASATRSTSAPRAESLVAAQIHGGAGVEEEAEGDGLHGWSDAGALTPVSRYAEMLSGEVSGTALPESGSEWYFPARLTLDTGAVGNGLANPAQEVLGLHSTMGERLPTDLRILAIDSELDKVFGGTQTTLTEAEALAAQSGISPSNLTLIEEKDSYAHNDPAGATPEINEFFKHMVPFLEGIAE